MCITSRYSHSSCPLQCHYQHNCHSLYNRCAHFSCPFWLSFLSVIFQPDLGVRCPRLSCKPEKSRSTLWSACGLQLSVKFQHQKYMEQRMPYENRNSTDSCSPQIIKEKSGRTLINSTISTINHHCSQVHSTVRGYSHLL